MPVIMINNPSDFAAAALATVTATDVENSAGAQVTSLTFDFSVPVGSNLLVLAVEVPGDVDPGTVSATYGGQAMSLQDSAALTGAESFMFTLFTPPTGLNEIAVTLQFAERVTIFPYAVSNAGSVRATGPATGGNVISRPVSTTSAADDLVIAGWAWRNSRDVAPTFGSGETGQTDLTVNAQFVRAAASWQRAGGTSTTATLTMNETVAGDEWAAVALAVAA